jgi:hypothetical protein
MAAVVARPDVQHPQRVPLGGLPAVWCSGARSRSCQLILRQVGKCAYLPGRAGQDRQPLDSPSALHVGKTSAPLKVSFGKCASLASVQLLRSCYGRSHHLSVCSAHVKTI